MTSDPEGWQMVEGGVTHATGGTPFRISGFFLKEVTQGSFYLG